MTLTCCVLVGVREVVDFSPSANFVSIEFMILEKEDKHFFVGE